MQGAKNGAKAEDLAEDAKDIEEVIIKANKKNAKDFSEFEALEFLKKYNFHGYYGLSDLKKIWARSMTLKFTTKEMVDFVKTGSLLKIERRYLNEEMTFFANQVKNKFVLQTSKFADGKYNPLRRLDVNNCGGQLLDLDWKDVTIYEDGIDMIKQHLERFEFDDWNERMIKRLEKIIDKEIEVTDFDLRFYTHELREFRRYKNLGREKTTVRDLSEDDFGDLWNNTHSATIEEYKVIEKEGDIYNLYHPDVQY